MRAEANEGEATQARQDRRAVVAESYPGSLHKREAKASLFLCRFRSCANFSVFLARICVFCKKQASFPGVKKRKIKQSSTGKIKELFTHREVSIGIMFVEFGNERSLRYLTEEYETAPPLPYVIIGPK